MHTKKNTLPSLPAPRPTPWAAGLLALGLSLLYLLALAVWSVLAALFAVG